MSAPAASQARSRWLVPGALLAAVVLALLFYLQVGTSTFLSFGEVFAEVRRGPGADSLHNTFVWNLRLPRACTVLLVGGLLGVVGSAFQALLRNPLADPYIMGVSSGAAVGGAISVVAGFEVAFFGFGMLLASFVGGLVSLALVYNLARRRSVVDIVSLLLAGVTVGALLSALLSMILLLSGHDTNRVLDFLMGHTSNARWPATGPLLGALVLGSGLLFAQSRRLNAFAMGERTAQRLGVDVPKLTRTVLVVGTAMTAAAVGAVGIIGFVGLVAPHIARRLVGVDWRVSLPTSGLVGMVVMLAADLVAQRALSMLVGRPGMEVNVGIVAALLGAPSLLILLRRAG